MHPMTYPRKARIWFCAALLAGALLLRVGLDPELRGGAARTLKNALASRSLFEAVLFLETGYTLKPGQAAPQAPAGETASSDTVPATDAAEAPSWTEAPGETEATGESAAETHSPADAPAETLPAPFTREDADFISMRGNCSYKTDKLELLTRPLGWSMQEGPKVLIIHSHSCESYTQCEGHSYLPDANFRTLQKEESVIAVGDALALELEKLGVPVLHDRSYNDYPSYNSSYAVAREKIAQWLEQTPSLVMVLDLHRDALENPVRETAKLGGVVCAPLMLVVGTDEGGLNHPHWQRNLSCALKLQALANREEPDLFKALSFRKERFNGDMTPGSLIVEVGSTENTLPEAVAAMPYLARYVAELLECP